MMRERLGRIEVEGDISRIVVGVDGQGVELVGGAVMTQHVVVDQPEDAGTDSRFTIT